MPLDPHALAERRSLDLHRTIALAILRNPGLVDVARERILKRLDQTEAVSGYAGAWLRWLELPVAELAACLIRDDEEGRAMRQSTPFTWVVRPRERWEIWKRSRQAWKGEP